MKRYYEDIIEKLTIEEKFNKLEERIRQFKVMLRNRFGFQI